MRLDRLLLTCVILFVFISTSFAEERMTIKKYFEGEDYELIVYFIKGRIKGKTAMILGGIQGDEPGGYLSADTYTDLSLEKGNLIVIPRANLKSVILYDRGPDGDMNRLFTNEKKGYNSGADKVVEILKEYMKESDIFLNLHDGWGYHNPVYVNDQRNPNKFGQSIIVDENEFTCFDGTKLYLGDMARSVLEAVNSKIDNKDYWLYYFDTRTSDEKSKFKQMRKTATWYALNNFCIPAFGIEASKNLNSLEDKILYHNYAVNEFLKIMDIVPEVPRVIAPQVEFYKAIITVDDVSIIAEDNDTVVLPNGALVSVKYIDASSEKGLTCDILGYGGLNDLGKTFNIFGETEILFKKDNKNIARIKLAVDNSSKIPPVIKDLDEYTLSIKINGEHKTIKQGTFFYVKKGDKLIINGASKGVFALDLPINLKGWVPPNVITNVGDDRGYLITVDDSFMKSYSLEKKGKKYPLVLKDEYDKELTKFFLEIED